MDKTLKVLNELERIGLIRRYAIGGAVASLFYMEPLLTYDLDVLVFLPETRGRLLTLSPIYGYLRMKGYKAQKEHVIIAGVPVQFIPAYNALVEEAVQEARKATYKGVPTRVLRVEHLLAILIQTSRPKDLARAAQLLEEATIDDARFAGVLERHGLHPAWRQFKKRFGSLA